MPLRKYTAHVEFYGTDPKAGRQSMFAREVKLPGTFANASNALKAAAQKIGAPPSGSDAVTLSVEEVVRNEY